LSILSPRYVYSSNTEFHHKALPYLNKDGYFTRFIGLANIPGKEKPKDSKNVYIQAIEVEPLVKISEKELKTIDAEYTESPYSKLH
jgi:hypothetical protein